MQADNILFEEIKRSFLFFWQEANHQIGSNGYGLMLDRSDRKDIASIASVGFALSAYVIGVERGFITYQQGLERVLGTLQTLAYKVDHYHGFFVHFANMDSAKRYQKCEYSTIDTAIVINGILTADSYFDEAEVHQLSQLIYKRIDWNHFVFKKDDKTYFHMSYNPDQDGDYAAGRPGFIYSWHMCAEQLMMYILAAGHDDVTSRVAKDLYLGFERPYKEYMGRGCYCSPEGPLFNYQFSHAWFDFRKYRGTDNIDWFENSRQATLANRQWCINQQQFKTFSEHVWGMSASDSPTGYRVNGAKPCLVIPSCDGTITPSAPAGSLPFAYEECAASLVYLYKNHPKIWGEYGFKDGLNLENGEWVSQSYIGIDKGVSLLMIDNAMYQTTWNYFMKHPIIIKAINKLSFIKTK